MPQALDVTEQQSVIEEMAVRIVAVNDDLTPDVGAPGWTSVCYKLGVRTDDFEHTRKENKDFNRECARLEIDMKRLIGEKALQKSLKDGRPQDALNAAKVTDPENFNAERSKGDGTVLGAFRFAKPLELETAAEDFDQIVSNISEAVRLREAEIRHIVEGADSDVPRC